MLKNAGVFLILLSAAGLGYTKSRELILRERNLRQLLQMIIYLKGSVRCGCASFPEAFKETAGKLSGVYREFLREISARMKNSQGSTLAEIYRRCAEEKLKDLRLSGAEQEFLFSIGGRLGYLDREMQLRQLELCEDEIQRFLEELRKEMPEKKKLYQSLGVLGGIFLAVLLW